MKYSENYIRICDETEAEVVNLLGRALTAREQQAIWGAGTLTWLEMRVQVPMRLAQAPDEIPQILLSAAEDNESRLADMIGGLEGMLRALLGRELSEAERQQLDRLPTVIAVMQTGESLTAATPEEREALLQRLLSEL